MADLPYKPESLSIMVIDDHDPIRKAIKRILIKMGIGTVIECFDGANASETLVDQPIDLIISDLYMRQMDGFELLSQIRNRDFASDIPIIIVTGEASKDDIVKSVDLGADDYLVKPFHAADLEKKVTTILIKYFSPTPLLKELRQGDRNMVLKKYPNALQHFEKALGIDPASVRAKHSRAVALILCNRVEEATKLLVECTRENSAYFRAFGTLADTYLQVGKVGEAVECMRREVELNPKNVVRQIALAKILLKRDDIESAIEHFKAALKINPKLKTALLGMGHALAKMGNLDKAIYYFKRVRRYHHNTTKALEAIVQYCEINNDIHRAEQLIKDEKNSHPDRIDAYLVLSSVQHKRDNSGAALETLNEALAKSPDHMGAHLAKGLLSLELRDYETALNSLTRVLKENPTIPGIIAYVEASIGMSKYEDATNQLNKLLLSSPSNPRVWLLMAEVYRRTGQHFKGMITYRKAIQMGANPSIFQNDLAACQEDVKARRGRRGVEPKKAAS